MQILDGKKISRELADNLRQQVSSVRGRNPQLVILQVGHVPASDSYIGRKLKFANSIGALGTLKNFKESVTTEELIEEVNLLNQDDSVHGIILQLPVPEGVDSKKVLNAISPTKDVDGLNEVNINSGAIVPATARGIVELLSAYNIELKGSTVAIVGSSLLGGQTISSALIKEGATVDIYDENTENVPEKTKEADILVSAVGKKDLITAEHVHENQVIVDVGIYIDEDGKVRGDVSEGIQSGEVVVGAVTPVPGGVGPMSVASLFQNLMEAYNTNI